VTTYWLRPIFAAAALGCAAPAQAQMFEGLPQQIAMTNLLLQPAIDSAKRAARGGGPAPTRKPRALRPAATAAVAATQYRSNPGVTARVRRQFADWLKSRTGADPAQSRQIEQALGGDFVGQWSKAVSEDGLRAGDAADALGADWLLNWIAGLIAANPQFATLSDAQRQEMAEIWMLNFLLHSAAYSAALTGKDANMAGRLGEAASARFRSEMGVDLRRLRITPSGFVPA
jgi:hypothetical protein